MGSEAVTAPPFCPLLKRRLENNSKKSTKRSAGQENYSWFGREMKQSSRRELEEEQRHLKGSRRTCPGSVGVNSPEEPWLSAGPQGTPSDLHDA